MDTIANMIGSRLREIDERHLAETRAGHPLHEASARATAKEERLWRAVNISTPQFDDLTKAVSGLRTEMRAERHARGDSPALRHMAARLFRLQNLLKVAASRASDREAALMRR